MQVSNLSPGADLNLYAGSPGTQAGSRDAGDYWYASTLNGSSPEIVTIACSGLAAHGGTVAVAVHAVTPGDYALDVQEIAATCVCGASSIMPGEQQSATVAQWGQIDYWELPTIPAGTSSILVIMRGPPPTAGADYDLMIGAPGVCGGDVNIGNYHGTCATTPSGWGSPLWRQEYTLAGGELAAYGSGPIALGVKANSLGSYWGGRDYVLEVLATGAAGAPTPSQATQVPFVGSIAPCRLDDWNPAGEDRWIFFAEGGQSIRVAVDTASEAGAFDPRAALFAPDGAIMVTSDDAVPCSWTPPQSGGQECPAIAATATLDGWYEISITRSGTGTCRDAGNGAYTVEVTVDNTMASLTPTMDDITPPSW
jgi:hypothetical protein